MADNIYWRFPPLSGGTQQGYTSNDMMAFKGDKIDNLAREICQNSLDAHLDCTSDPVKVVFELQTVQKTKYPIFSQYKECLEGCRRFWGNDMDDKLRQFVDQAESTLNEKEIPILVISDYNTKGLSGSHSEKKTSSWKALTESDGVSVKSDIASAGSYGIGKNAPFTCSSLSMVFYNTFAEDNESAFIGVARLATLLQNEQPTQRVGRYQVNNDESADWKPIYPENEDDFRDIFQRKEFGTDVIIVGFSQVQNWLDNVTKAVLKNFFVAISEKKLIVELKDGEKHTVIDSDSIVQYFTDLVKDSQMVTACQLYQAFTSGEKKTFEVLEPEDVEVYFKVDANYKRTIANFRATGMLVGSYRKNIIQHYAAVVIVRGEKLGELLKDTEPTRHNDWDYRLIDGSDKRSSERRKEAKRAIETIQEHVLHLLKFESEEVPEKTVDAAGVGEYIPDNLEGIGGESMGDDILKPKVQIDKIRTNKSTRGSTKHVAVQSEGIEQKGEVHNNSRNPRSVPKTKPPVPVEPNSNHLESRHGATPGEGLKTVRTPNLVAQRAFLSDASQGIYKIVIKPAEDYNNLFVECFAVGEDGNPDSLEMKSFTYDEKEVKIVKGKAGPIKVQAGISTTFLVTFQRKEKMTLKLQLTEEVRK